MVPLDLEQLTKIASAVEPHFVNNGWVKPDKPVFGDWSIYSDNGKGMGRQLIACVPANKHYGFTEVAAHIATFDPPTVLRLLGEQTALMDALNLALTRLARLEPGDSRAVSDEFVAMASVAAGNADSSCLAIISKALAEEGAA